MGENINKKHLRDGGRVRLIIISIQNKEDYNHFFKWPFEWPLRWALEI